ncbi:uncharacterized protein LOC122504271 [Leptopilina heterotoma]|uniref:uncharacterized protein LOC122504271 n=1 Tax=Leptopilina heterotoma TaxID=63436 RepID=UPI001CA89047|nr:uncharacterized protein LOC122504271 [Leptopilina heterotoma]XP_043471234.1 uncharacterized protein LOC122504271 [Leptopilina heterotoma]
MSSTVLTPKPTSKNNSSANTENDSSTQKKKDRGSNSTPVLKKSNKTAHAFGPAYFHSVKEAVFEIPYAPFLPQTIPEPLRLPDYQSETFHPCLQCKDSFRFPSTLEEHMSRRSWILGYWCQSCFHGKCDHVPLHSPMCGNCVSTQYNRRTYLRSKGMKKGQKAAIIKIFYNQCEFFNHLKQHDVSTVEINELMLMPLPWDIKKEEHPKLEKACKAIMEYAFLNRIHIMEFLRDQKFDGKWWDPPVIDENTNNYQIPLSLSIIIQTFRERDFTDSVSRKLPSPNKNSLVNFKTAGNDSLRLGINSVSVPANNIPVRYCNSPYRPPTDIAFVDCGPSHSVYKSNSLLSPPSLSPLSVSKNDGSLNSSSESKELDSSGRRRNAFGQFIKQSTQASQQPIIPVSTSTTSNKVYTVSTNTNASGPKISVKKFASEPVSNWAQCPDKANTKILTVHSEKCLDISSIISQLPPDVINSKKIVFIEQNSNQINQYQKNSPQTLTTGPTLSANCVKVNVPQANKNQKPSVTSRTQVVSQQVFKTTKSPTNPTYPPKTPPEPKLRPSLTPIASKNSKNIKIQPYDGKVFFQSGKKFVIKQTNKLKPTGISASVLKPTTQARKVPNLFDLPALTTKKLHRSVTNIASSPLTPSTSPSELSTSSCESLSKIFDEDLSLLRPYDNIKSRSDFNMKNISESEEALLTIKVVASKLYLHLFESLPSVKNTKNNLMKYKQNLLDTLPYLRTKDIQKRIDHVNALSQEFLKAMKLTDDKIIDDHERFIALLTDSVEQAKILNIPQNIDDVSLQHVFELQHESDNKFLDNWKSQPMQKCPQCAKLKKPKNYLPGFSKLSDNEALYCQCYNCFCSKCNTHQGTLPRFVAHRNYHSKISPFVCPDCCRKFDTFQEVEKHIWLECFHPLMKNWFFGCKVCGIDGLTTLEALTQHFLLMHSKRGYVCSDCKAISFLESDYQNHLTMEHDAMLKGDNQLEMVEIIMCKIGNCIVLKENYTKHLIDHVGVEHQIFHKCPFCPFTKRHASKFVMEEFREHVMTNHRLLLSRFATKDIINQVQKALKVNVNQEVLPMIINTRTIAREAFEKGTQDFDTDRGLSSMPMIVDVRSEAANLNTNNDTMPKILEVKSIANDSLLKKSQESRKRKANTVIEITLSPKKISSVEIKNGKVDANDSGKKSEVKGFSQVKEILLEKRSLTGGGKGGLADVEIIELEKTVSVTDVDKPGTAKASIVAKTQFADDSNRDEKNVCDKSKEGNNKDVSKKDTQEAEPDEKNKKIDDYQKDVNKSTEDDNSRISTNRERRDPNKGGEEQEVTTVSECSKISRERTEDIRSRETFPKTKEITSNVCLDERNQVVGENRQNFHQRKLDVNQRGDANQEEEIVHREEEINREKETNKVGEANQEKKEEHEGDANQVKIGDQGKEGIEGNHNQEKGDDQETEGVNQQSTDASKRNQVNKRQPNICGDNENFIGNPEEVCKNTANSDDNICKASVSVCEGNIICKDDSTKDDSTSKDEIISRDSSSISDNSSKNNISRDSCSISDNSSKNNVSGDNSSKNNTIIRDNSSNSANSSSRDIISRDNSIIKINIFSKEDTNSSKDGISISNNSTSSSKTSIYVNKEKININEDPTNDKPNTIDDDDGNDNFDTNIEHKSKQDKFPDGSSIKNSNNDEDSQDSNEGEKIIRTEFNRPSSTNEANRDSNTPKEIIDKCKNVNPLIPSTEDLGTNTRDKNEDDKTDDPENLNNTVPKGNNLQNLNEDSSDFLKQDNNINKNLNDYENVIKDNENFLCDNTTVIKDRLAVIEEVSSIGDNEDINDNNIATGNYSRVTNKSNELILRHKDEEILPKNNFSILNKQFLTKDKEFLTNESAGNKNQNLKIDIQCSIKCKESYKPKSLEENESSEDYQFPPVESSNDSEYSQETNVQTLDYQSPIMDDPSNTQSSTEQIEFSIGNSNTIVGTEQEQIDDTCQGEKNLLESEENSSKVHDFSALEDLKAKMSRTFKTLAKRMEATTTTLQQECSKSLPMLKGFKNMENGSNFINEVRTRTRQKRRRSNWQKLTSNVYENNYEKFNLKEKILYDDDSSNSSEIINYQRRNNLMENIRLDGDLKEDFKIEIIQPPPPLARIPQHILKNHSITETTRRVRKRKQSRIAFNGPLNYEETALDFKCHICSKLINSSWPVLKAHFDIWHPNEYIFAELNPQLLKISSDYIDGGYKEILCKKFKCDATSPRKRKRRSRFTPKSPEKIDQKSIGICVKAESVLEDDGMFKCRKCDVKFIDMDQLRQHISKSHRIKGRYLVCLECGENFVVAPSLQMHLKAFHAIDDPLTYLLQNTSFAPENLEDTEEEEEEVIADENQCFVCMAVFENKAAVDKHLRVHGMAFLNRKRMEAKKNLNITEKKLKMTTQTDDACCGSASISLNPTKHQDDKQILATNSLETEVSVH